MKQRTGRKLLGILLSLVMVLGLMPGMSLTAYAEDDSKSITLNGSDASGSTSYSQDNITIQYYSFSGYMRIGGGHSLTVTAGSGRTIQSIIVTLGAPASNYGPNTTNGDLSTSGNVITVNNITASSVAISANTGVQPYISSVTVNYKEVTLVTGVSLNLASATLTAGGDPAALTATVLPADATDKTVKWSVGGTNAGAVKLFTDEACTTEVGSAATDKLTVYAKGISAGSATVTVTTNDGNKTDNCSVTVNPVTYPVTYKVVNGTWSDGSTTDKKETVADGSKPASVPTGMKAASGFTGGAWDNDPAEATITGATTFTYTFTAKPAATVTKAPEAKTLTYNGQAQALVTAGEATGGTMQYALGENATTTPADNLYTTSIPTGTDAGTYYVWFKVAGDDNHNDVDPDHVTVEIKNNDQQKADEVTALIKELPYFNKVRTSDEEDILAARAAYEALTDAQKKLVKLTAVRKLKNAETALAGAKKAELQKKKREIAEELADENYVFVREKRAEDAIKAKDDIKEKLDPIKTRSREVQEVLDDIDKSAKAVADKTRDAASKITSTAKRLIKQAIDMIRRR